MRTVQHLTMACLCLGLLAPGVGLSENVYLKEMPKAGDVPHRKIVYVDDGQCPKGEVKEVTGGSKEKNVPRKVRCVKRPDKATPPGS